METTYNHKQFKTLLKWTLLITRVMLVLFIIAAGVAAVAGIAVSFVSSREFEFYLKDFEQLNVEIYNSTINLVNLDVTSAINGKPILVSGLFLAFAYLTWLIGILKSLSSFMRDVQKDQLFTSKNVKRIKMIAYLFIVGGIVLPIFGFVFGLQVMDAVSELNLEVTYSLNLFYIFVGMVILILANVFEYGTYLQNEYDATV